MPKKKKIKKEKEVSDAVKKETSQDKKEFQSQTKELPRQTKELYWVLGVMAITIILFFIVYSFFQSLNNFEYKGLTFAKEKFGEIPVYHYYYYYKNPATKSTVKYNLFLRNDPRENKVPVNGEIYLVKDVLTYISVAPANLTQCKYSSVAISNLVSFLTDNLVPVKSATPDEKLAEEMKVPHMTCDTELSKPKIIIQAGDETSIKREKTNCYIMTINNCEILQATEKFTVQSILDAKARQAR